MTDVPELLDALSSPEAIVVYFAVVLLFGFFPGYALRWMVKLYPDGDERRLVLIADMYELPLRKRWFFVAQQLETVLFEGLPARLHQRRPRSIRHRLNQPPP